MTYDKIWLTSLTCPQHLNTCGYWYVVTCGAMAHTAFKTKAGVLQWANERGLTITKWLPDPGTSNDLASGVWTTQDIVGTYRTEMHWDDAAFNAMPCLIETRTLSNGDYVVAKITQDADGIRTVHTLNPNVKTRHVFPYVESDKMIS